MEPSRWKYLSVGLMAVLAIGFAVPQASGHITTKAAHVLEHIYNFVDGIEAKTDRLPNDPASQTLIDTQLQAIQSDTNDIQTRIGSLSGGGASPKSVGIHLTIDPNITPEGEFDDGFRELLPYVPGKTYSGHMTGHFSVAATNRGDIGCVVGIERDIVWISVLDGPAGINEDKFSVDFACDEIRLNIMEMDPRVGVTTNTLVATIQYLESTDLSEMSS